VQTYVLQIAFGLTIVLGGLALVLTVSGLFSVLSYLVEQQARDFGVRMALGAITTHIVRLVLTLPRFGWDLATARARKSLRAFAPTR
jgi:ABC-type antimicrobial peptide transport system permease subunit